MKSNKIIALLSFLLIPALAFAQNWTQDTTFVPVEGDSFFEVHGVAVDGEGRVWVQQYYWNQADLVVQRDLNGDGMANDTVTSSAIYIYNQDGTPADFSPLQTIEYEDESMPADTLYRRWDGESYEALSGRGIEADQNGDIIISSFDRLIKVDHQSVKAVAKVVVNGASLTEASTDSDGNIYVSNVAATDAPIYKFDSNLENPEELVTLTSGFSRDFQVSADGNTIWWAGYTGKTVLKYTRPDEFSGFSATPDTVLRGFAAESFDIHPVTGYLWVGSGSLNDVPEAPYQPQTWYAFDTSTLGTDNEVPLDSIRWTPGADVSAGYDNARPRGLDFSADGKTAFLGGFSGLETDVDVQKFTTEQVFTSNENEAISDVPKGYELQQNYPNPFNPTTNINYSINESGAVTLKVYDMTGREVATLVNERMSAGSHQVQFDASNLSSGVYIYSLQANGVRLTNKMTLIK
jgi:hypothetical protein